MDPAHRNLFSRGSSPPHAFQDQTLPPQQSAKYQHVSPPHSIHEISQHSPPASVESLFSNLIASTAAPQPTTGIVPASAANFPGGPIQQSSNSAPATPVSITANSVSSTTSAPINTAESRQSALLSLLGTVSPAASTTSAPQQQQQQQIPTPPGSSHRSGPSNNNESQGRMLLEQLMAGNAPQSNYGNPSPQSSLHLLASDPSPAIGSSSNSQHETGSYYEPETNTPQGPLHDDFHTPTSVTQAPPPQQPSLPPKSLFDFVSPFDALASTSVTSPRKPVPPISHSVENSSSNEDWLPSTSASSVDAKRKSVENLIEQMTRGQPPPPPTQLSSGPYELGPPLSAPDDVASPEQVQARVQPRPLPPKPSYQPGSPPRSSPPKPSMPPPQRKAPEQPVGPLVGSSPVPPAFTAQAPAPRDKESSPGPRGSWNKQEGRRGGSKGKNQSSPHSQTIIFDVNQPLEEIQASREAVKSTAIALVRVDSTFLPGTTIGATQWVAYAMTKGRVRVISRSSGDRTLLQLPHVFPGTTAVTDMAVLGNRLAGVTSDGGLVVWELPDVITDDVPGKILLCVLPSAGPENLRSVKWHPRQPDILAISSETGVFLVNILHASRMFGGDPVDQSDLHRLAQPFDMPTPLVAFGFDVEHSALTTISEDSTLAMWDINSKFQIWSAKIRGDDTPSSLTLVDGGVVIGRKHNNVFQLLSTMRSNVLATFKFTNGDRDDPDMFAHANYDSRLQTLWVAHNRRDSMIALKLGFDYADNGHDEGGQVRGSFTQVVEFLGPKPTIHFVILTADQDPNGEEAHAACVAAKVPPGELALVAFSVHSTGVDQILIRQEWFDVAFATTQAKLPPVPPQIAQQIPVESRAHRPPPQQQQIQPPPQPQQQPVIAPPQRREITPPPPASLQAPVIPLPPATIERNRTPPSEEVEPELTREPGRPSEARGGNKGGRNRNVGWKDRDEREQRAGGSGNRGGGDGNSNSNSSEASIGAAMAKEIKKMEENLYSRIGRLVGKELDKQHQRLEEVRVSEQQADFDRQEKILKLISSELSKNTTRVVEMAVKAEVQSSVLPALADITQKEVRAAVNGQIVKGLGDSMTMALPSEIEKLLMRPDLNAHFARTVSSAVTPIIERHVKDAITKTLIPAYTQQSANMHQELTHEMHAEMLNLKKEVIAWQSEALRGQETVIRELEASVRTLADQVKFLSLNANVVPSSHPHAQPSPPMPSNNGSMVPYQQSRQPSHQAPPPPMQQHSYGPLPQHQQHQHQPPPPPWGHGIPAPQASHPAIAPQVHHPSPPVPIPVQHQHQHEDWDQSYLDVLSTQDPRQLRELLGRSNPEVIMPLNGQSPLSQAVILTIVHRLGAYIGESAPEGETFKSSIWWLQRAATVLKTNDPIIAPYCIRVLPNVQQLLNITKQRISILPGGAQAVETSRALSDIQDILSHKPT